MNDVAVFPDGTVDTNTEWDGAGRDAGAVAAPPRT